MYVVIAAFSELKWNDYDGDYYGYVEKAESFEDKDLAIEFYERKMKENIELENCHYGKFHWIKLLECETMREYIHPEEEE